MVIGGCLPPAAATTGLFHTVLNQLDSTIWAMTMTSQDCSSLLCLVVGNKEPFNFTHEIGIEIAEEAKCENDCATQPRQESLIR
jgi:hypothetical protein